MQIINSEKSRKAFMLIPLLLIIPLIGFLLITRYTHLIDKFFISIIDIIPESCETIIGFIIILGYLFSAFFLCCVSSFTCGKIISEDNKYIYLIKFFMCIFWVIGIFFTFIISDKYNLLISFEYSNDTFLIIGFMFFTTILWLLIKAVVDIIQFVYAIIKNRKRKSSN